MISILFLVAFASSMQKIEFGSDPLHITVGSCFDHRQPYQDIFKSIASDNPDVFVWAGDLAYVSRTKRLDYLSYLE